jgi:hypothetical protein
MALAKRYSTGTMDVKAEAARFGFLPRAIDVNFGNDARWFSILAIPAILAILAISSCGPLPAPSADPLPYLPMYTHFDPRSPKTTQG